MKEQDDPLKRLRVASPCRAGWGSMSGDDRVRFCRECGLHVYNFSEMTAGEVRALVARTEGRVCGRLFRRADGTMITRDCPAGLRAVRRRVARAAGASLAAVIGLFTAVAGKPKAHKVKQCTAAQVSSFERTQSPSSMLTGRVLDPGGAVIAGALVTLRGEQTGAIQAAASNAKGEFSFDAPPGAYTLTVVAGGFNRLSMTGLRINAVETLRADVVLQAETREELIGVIAVDPLLSDSGEIRTTFNEKQITSLPHG